MPDLTCPEWKNVAIDGMPESDGRYIAFSPVLDRPVFLVLKNGIWYTDDLFDCDRSKHQQVDYWMPSPSRPEPIREDALESRRKHRNIFDLSQ